MTQRGANNAHLSYLKDPPYAAQEEQRKRLEQEPMAIRERRRRRLVPFCGPGAVERRYEMTSPVCFRLGCHDVYRWRGFCDMVAV